jgi:uncharacterized RDD family membrane protein YckC
MGHLFQFSEPLNKKNDHSGSPCGLFRRLAIMVYDGVVVISLLMLATLLAMMAGFGGQTAMKDPFFTFYLASVWFLYLAWCWRKGGMTVGMRAWRVRIENRDGRNPGWGAIALRFLVSLVSAGLAGLGFLWSLFDADKRTWHDMISATRLVRH